MEQDIFFCWGKYFKKKLLKYNKNTKFYIVGNPFIKRQKSYKNKVVFLLSPKTLFISSEIENKFFNLIKDISKKYKITKSY